MIYLEFALNAAVMVDIALDAEDDDDDDDDDDSTIIYYISCILVILYYNVMINNRVLNENNMKRMLGYYIDTERNGTDQYDFSR